MQNINLLDCTLRDGGYYNNWSFAKNLINHYLNCLSKTKIKNVEIGFLTIPRDNNKGITANCDHNFFQELKIPKNLDLGLMINATDFFNLNPKKIFNILDKLPSKKIKFIRIATHISDVNKIIKYIKFLKKKNFLIFLNIMQISEIKNNEIKNICKMYGKIVNAIYFADSFGSLNKNQLIKIINKFKKNTNIDLGIHAHNNMNKALSNTLIAYSNGVKWLDSTVLGMGRGPGNTKTEELIRYFYGKKSNDAKEVNKILSKFEVLRKKFKWGTNKYYFLSGKYKIHPTYIQMLLTDKIFKKCNIKKTIYNLKKFNPKKYSYSNLINSCSWI